MVRTILVAVLAAGACVAAFARRSTSVKVGQQSLGLGRAAALEVEDRGQSPVKRVVLLLEKMKAELQAEADKESENYDKMVCWCETNHKEKTQSVANLEAKDLELSTETESRSAQFGEQATAIAQLKTQIGQDTAALKQATAIREEAAGKFRAEEKDMVQAINNLRNAIAVLSKHHGGSLLQVQSPLTFGLHVVLRDVMLKYEMLLAGEADHGHRSGASAGLLQTVHNEGLKKALVKELGLPASVKKEALPVDLAERLVAESAGASANSFVQAPVDADYKSYSSRSTQIFGILNQMLDEFTSQLSAMQKEEQTSAEDYGSLATAKKAQLATGKEKLDDTEGEHAANQKALSDAKEDLDLTRKQRTADVEFLKNLKLTCNDLDKEWQRRSATRAEELKAVAEAIAILTSDENREQLVKSVSLLQEQERNEGSASARRTRVVEVLRRAASSPAFDTDDFLAAWHSRHRAPGVGEVAGPRVQLSVLATTAKLDSFEKVREMMDKMLVELKEQQKEEADFKAYCIKAFDENEKAVYAKKEQKGDLEAKMDSLAGLMATLDKEITAAKAQISATQVDIKKASEVREAENKEFQIVVADQRAAQDILTKALLRLKDFYMKSLGKKVIYLQRSVQTPPVKFTNYTDNAGASPVIGLLEQIIEDSKTLESEAVSAEAKGQADYEQFVKDSNTLVGELSNVVLAKTDATAAAKLESAEAHADVKSTTAELESLAMYEADLHSQCDFIQKNFEIRQRARLQEMEAIQAAKAILSGAQAPELPPK